MLNDSRTPSNRGSTRNTACLSQTILIRRAPAVVQQVFERGSTETLDSSVLLISVVQYSVLSNNSAVLFQCPVVSIQCEYPVCKCGVSVRCCVLW